MSAKVAYFVLEARTEGNWYPAISPTFLDESMAIEEKHYREQLHTRCPWNPPVQYRIMEVYHVL